MSRIQRWNLDFVKKSRQGSKFKLLADRISECLNFMSSCGVTSKNVRQLSETNFYISHEALLLPYESPRPLELMVQQVIGRIHQLTWYGLGIRTRQLNGAHVEFCRGISNPIGIKVGPSTNPDELIKVVKKRQNPIK